MLTPTTGTETGDTTGHPILDGDTAHMDMAIPLSIGALARGLLMLSLKPRLMLMPTTGTETGDTTGHPILDGDAAHMDMAIPLSIGSLARDLLMRSLKPRLMLMPTTGMETGDTTGPPTPDPDGDTVLMDMAILHGITRDKNLQLIQMTSK